MLTIKGIDNDKCIKCLECTKECPSNLFYKPPTPIGEKRRVIFSDTHSSCIICGHCIAVCPTDAILYDSDDSAMKFNEINEIGTFLDYTKLLLFLRSRRSIRRFKSKDVETDKIKKILEAMRYSPSANNAQSWQFLVLTEKVKIDKIRQGVIQMMSMLKSIVKYQKLIKHFLPKKIKKIIQDPSTKIGLEYFFKRIENGEDPVFYNAPVLLITYSPKLGSMTELDAGIAFTHAMLAGHSLGLGTCWIGYAQEALRRFKKLSGFLNIPNNMKVNGVLIIGYPDIRYYRVPPRNPLEINWN